jgi:hypothetical protein
VKTCCFGAPTASTAWKGEKLSSEQFHSPQKALADLRDHLARHDKPIAFLFGAGTSCSVTVLNADGKGAPLIPAVPGLTSACKKDVEALGAKYQAAWNAIEAHIGDIGLAGHVENILTRVRMMLSAISKSDTLAGLNEAELKRFEECVRTTIARIVTPDLTSLGADIPHRKFARWLSKSSRRACVEIFTLNYDVLVEHALEAERVPVFDGFVGSYQPFFHPDSLRRIETAPGPNWTRLWKMHGSVTWRRVEQDGRSRVVRGEPDGRGEMILPSFQKYDESRLQPYSAFTDRLGRFLDQDDALLIIAGFSFGDEHVNNLIFGALENRPRTHVYALQFDEPRDESDLIRRGAQRSNLIVMGPHTGVIGSRRAKWNPAEPSSFAKDCVQISEEIAGDAKSRSLLMKIGDFARFSQLLESMTN